MALSVYGINVLKKKLDINSPSRVMENEVGVFIPQGIAKGIEKDNSAEKAVQSKSIQIVDAAPGALDAIGNDMDTNRTGCVRLRGL